MDGFHLCICRHNDLFAGWNIEHRGIVTDTERDTANLFVERFEVTIDEVEFVHYDHGRLNRRIAAVPRLHAEG